jgi:hypothetical protein
LKLSSILLAAVWAVAGCGQGDESLGASTEDLNVREPPALGPHAARGQARGGSGGGGGSPDLIFHNGGILTASRVNAIFWGPSWNNAGFVGDKISGLDSFYGGIGGSAYMGTNTEYTGTNGQVGTGVTYQGHLVDLSASPNHAPRTSTIANEVCRMINNPASNGYYPVYTDTPRGHAGYCAWHSYGTCQGVPVQFGFFFNLDGDPGCDPQDTSTSHSQGLAALANVSGHELSETVTDPRNGGWYDSSGAENADKCAWTFNGTESFGGQSWKIQGNWSNNAYNNGQTGYANGGCINGN